MPQIVLKQPGQPVAEFAFTGAIVTVAGVVIDCAARQLDTDVAIEIRNNRGDPGEGGNGAYLAQISIPARRFMAMARPALRPMPVSSCHRPGPRCRWTPMPCK
ncbi:hypothetical protein O3297_00685 [Janthinobacterium sp. SUN128]|uniref:hypothetical protein n=1 Tax=Janthinobacterium sp. SUN128 TaxID=3014790 RepID=UPI002712AC7D|nr:hypothetical protein [Janthinobacterium sp. SUN128]MDO8031917.1 hypothetical protein [Janthinobacterium sp. SUN128]